MPRFLYYLTGFCILALCFPLFSQSEKIPIDPNVTIGKLKNGITYYIRTNKKPEKRAELRLVVNAGSILEDENQKGLAHLVEHMAFNGTTHFKHNELENYLESIGVRFGADLNAGTSFDETVYQLQVPTDKPDLLEKGFLVLDDWAHGLLFDSVEVEKERGVVTEEWRLGRGARMRMLNKQFPILFHDSKYADRLPIGDVEIIKHCPQDVLRKFYTDWYRPDLMAVVAVGDFDKAQIEALIKAHFEDIASPKTERPREISPVPAHEKTLFAIASDKEATYTVVALYTKRPHETYVTLTDYKKEFVQSLFQSMMNARLQELTQLPDPPFMYGYSSTGEFVRSTDVNFIQAVVKDGGVKRGLETILREAERVRQFGFTATELARHKASMLRGYEEQLAEKDKTESGALIEEYISHFLSSSPIPGVENGYELCKKFLPEISLDDVNKLSAEATQTTSRVVLLSAPEKDSVKLPDEAELADLLGKVTGEKLTPYVDNVKDQPLVDKLLSPGTIVSTKPNAFLDYTEWRLSNGARVLFKITDFKNDEILFNAVSPGGTSLVEDSDYVTASTATDILNESGLGNFNKTELQKALTGKIAYVNPDISQYDESLQGSCSPKDAETMFQLTYLYFTNPRFDSSAFISYKEKRKAWFQNMQNEPRVIYNDTLTNTLNNYNFRFLPWTAKTFDQISLTRAAEIYKERFSDADGFTFIFTGNIDTNTIKQLVQKYLASLPAKHKNEHWRNLHITNPTGIVEKTVKRGIEPKSTVTMIYTGDCKYSRHNQYVLNSLTDAMDIRLREVIREDKGGSYGVRVNYFYARYPKGRYHFTISFGCDPQRVDELTTAAWQVIDSMKQFGPTPETLEKVKATQKRAREVDLKQNWFWASHVCDYLLTEDNPAQIMEYSRWNEALTAQDIKTAAQTYFNQQNYIKVVLLPEDKKQ